MKTSLCLAYSDFNEKGRFVGLFANWVNARHCLPIICRFFDEFRPIFAICPIDFYYQVIGVFKSLDYPGRFDSPKFNRFVFETC